MAVDEEIAILQRLAMLAEQSRENISEPRIEFTARKLLPLGTRAVCDVLENMLESARRFPTVGEVKAALGMDVATGDDKAREVAERIFSGIGRFHSMLPGSDTAALRAYLGDIGWHVVTLAGGWNSLCDSVTYANAPTYKAQWRELAAAMERKYRRGNLNEAPQFDRLSPAAHEGIKALTDKFTP